MSVVRSEDDWKKHQTGRRYVMCLFQSDNSRTNRRYVYAVKCGYNNRRVCC